MIRQELTWPDEDYDAQAAYWLARLMSTHASVGLRKAFEVWRDEDIGHAEAFERALLVWRQTEALSLDPEILELRKGILNDAFRPRGRSIIKFAGVAAGLALAFISFIFVADISEDEPAVLTVTTTEVANVVVADMTVRDQFITDPNEFTTVVLPDGSVMDLNADTEVAIAFGNQTRSLHLLKGQAVFKVAHNPERPFSVLAAGQSITALGTEFEVTLEQDALSVVLLEGKVVVDKALTEQERIARDVSSTPIQLQPGQQLIANSGSAPFVKNANLASTGIWRRDSLAFNGEQLGTVAMLLNRYSDDKIIIDDESLNNLEIGGTYKTSSRDGLVAAITHFYPVTAYSDPSTGDIHFSWDEKADQVDATRETLQP